VSFAKFSKETTETEKSSTPTRESLINNQENTQVSSETQTQPQEKVLVKDGLTVTLSQVRYCIQKRPASEYSISYWVNHSLVFPNTPDNVKVELAQAYFKEYNAYRGPTSQKDITEAKAIIEKYKEYQKKDLCIGANIEGERENLYELSADIKIYDENRNILYFPKIYLGGGGALEPSNEIEFGRRFNDEVFSNSSKVSVIIVYGTQIFIPCDSITGSAPVYSTSEKCDIKKLKSAKNLWVFDLMKEEVTN